MVSQQMIQQGADKREQILEYVKEAIKESGLPPTFAEIRDACGFTSNSVVYHHMKILKEKRRLSWTPGKARTIKVLDGERERPV